MWNDVQQSSGNFLKIEEGKKVTVHALFPKGGEPVSYYTHWIPQANNGKGQTVTCVGKGCPACKDVKAYPLRARHLMNVWDFATNSIKILEQGGNVMSQIKSIYEISGNNLNGVDLVISRTGSRLETKYVVIAIPTKFKEKLKASDLFDLNAQIRTNTAAEIKAAIGGGAVISEAEPAAAVETPEEGLEETAEKPADASGIDDFLQDIGGKQDAAEALDGNDAVEAPADRESCIKEITTIITTNRHYRGANAIHIVEDIKAVSGGKKKLVKDLSDEEIVSLLDIMRNR